MFLILSSDGEFSIRVEKRRDKLELRVVPAQPRQMECRTLHAVEGDMPGERLVVDLATREKPSRSRDADDWALWA